jgi:electron-transferring-flavoprotein dehydrogenase
VPPPLQNHGNYVISLNQLVKWLAAQAEARGVDSSRVPRAPRMLYERAASWACGRRQGHRQARNRKPNFEPGVDSRAKVTILAEGARGSLTKPLVPRLKLDQDRFRQVYSTA